MSPAIDTNANLFECIRRLECENVDLHDAVAYRDRQLEHVSTKLVNVKKHLDAVEKKRKSELAALLVDLQKSQLQVKALQAELGKERQHLTNLSVAINLGTPDGAIVASGLAKRIAQKIEKAFA